MQERILEPIIEKGVFFTPIIEPSFDKYQEIVVDLNAPITDRRPPKNHSALEQAYEEIVSGQIAREVAVTFLTDEKGMVVPVFALTGEKDSVHYPFDYHLDLLKELQAGQAANALVYFHSHPEREQTKPRFSGQDLKIHESLVYQAHANNLDKIRIYHAVSNLNGKYAWIRTQLLGKPNLITIDTSPYELYKIIPLDKLSVRKPKRA